MSESYSSRPVLQVVIAVLLLITAMPEPGRAITPEQKVKAAYLHHLAEFTTWPSDAFVDEGAPLVMGFIEGPTSDIANFMEKSTQEGLSVKNRRVVIERIDCIDDAGNPQDTDRRDRFNAALHRCHLLFIPRGTKPRCWDKVHELVADRPIVTVSDTSNFANSGGHIQFTPAPRGSLDIYINLPASRQNGLTFSSRFLSLERVFIISNSPSVPTEGQEDLGRDER